MFFVMVILLALSNPNKFFINHNSKKNPKLIRHAFAIEAEISREQL